MKTLLCLLPLFMFAASVSAEDPLMITKATYGDHEQGKAADFTAKVQAKVSEGKLRLVVWNDLFGDPAEGTRKELRVEFTLNGNPGSLKVAEGETLLIPALNLTGPLHVISATYGILPDTTYDVTDLVKRRVRENSLKLEVKNDEFGDPASGEFKWLKIVYRIGDVELVRQAWEGQDVSISVPSDESTVP